jgi:hypothetical protein
VISQQKNRTENRNGQLTTTLQLPNAVKKIITKPSPNNAKATNSRQTTLYHRLPTTDQQSCIANQNAATAISPNNTA